MEHLDGRLRTSEAGSLYFYTVRPALSDALPERQKALRQISVSECEFSKPVDQVFLIQTGTAPGDIHVADRLSQTSCLLHPDFLSQVKKISTLSDRHLPEGFLPLREFCLYSKRQFLRKKYKNIRFCYVKSLYFRYTSKIKKFRTKIPDFGTFLYGIRCFGAFCTKLTCYLFSFSFSSGWKSAKVERFVSFPNIQV